MSPKTVSKSAPTLGAPSARNIEDYTVVKRTKQLLDYIGLSKKVILDIGCANGCYTLKLADQAEFAIGIDIQRKRLQEASENKTDMSVKNVDFLAAAAEFLPFHDREFDMVSLIEVLEHVQNEDKVLQEANRVLKKNGNLVMHVPNKLYIFETHGMKIGELEVHGIHGSVPFFSYAPKFLRKRFERARIYDKWEIVKIIKKHSFSVEIVDYLFPPLDNLNSRLLRRLFRKIFYFLEKNSFMKKFGMSILVIAKKPTDYFEKQERTPCIRNGTTRNVMP